MEQNLENANNRENLSNLKSTYNLINSDFAILQNGNALQSDKVLFKQSRLSFEVGLIVHF